MTTSQTAYAIRTTLDVPYDEAVARTRAALAEEGFGVITEIDVRGTFEKKLSVEFRPYVILGACSPPVAHQALTAELDIGLLLPCNVVVYAGDKAGTSVVAALDPVAQLSLAGRDDIRPMAEEIRSRLARVVSRVQEA
jgi:uncharacterized protein (DUF302 family)